VRSEARYAAHEALRLDPMLAEAHAALGQILFDLDWDWTAANVEIKRAIELDPGNADAFVWASYLARVQGRVDDAEQQGRRAAVLDPLSYWSYESLAGCYLANGKFNAAADAYRRAIDLAPSGSQLHFLLGWALIAGGQPAAALTEMKHESDERYRDVGLALALDALGRNVEADRALTSAEAKYPPVVEYPIAAVYAKRKNLDGAFEWLNRAVQ
jgi:tetratricopeptide (TPR) repeat protein